MTHWAGFPARSIGTHTDLHRIHQALNHPAWFNSDGTHRFDPPSDRANPSGACYLGLEPLTAYVEVFGRLRAVPQSEMDRRRWSRLALTESVTLADLTNRKVLGHFNVTAAHSTGTDYAPAQELGSSLYEAGFAGILYRIRHDPQMELEAIALFGEPGVSPGRFTEPRTGPIPDELISAGRAFGIEVLPDAPLP